MGLKIALGMMPGRCGQQASLSPLKAEQGSPRVTCACESPEMAPPVHPRRSRGVPTLGPQLLDSWVWAAAGGQDQGVWGLIGGKEVGVHSWALMGAGLGRWQVTCHGSCS